MTTAYVATIGGHISELVELATRLPEDDEIWITSDSPQTRDLLRDRSVETVPFIEERDVLGVLRAVPTARRLFRRHNVDRVVSTGSAIALGYLPVAAAMGIETHYIESSTRVHSSSMSGRILAKTPGVKCWWQFESPPDGFQRAGGVYDGYVAEERPIMPDLQRIVVSVGTTKRDFRRLIERLVSVIPPEAEVLWQTGHTDISGLTVDGRNIEGREMVGEAELIDALTKADLVITHAGAGSLALALKAGKVPVFVPRRAEFDEQIDDHQVELAQWAAENRLAVTVEADKVGPSHLEAAARLQVASKPVGKLVLQ